MRIRLMPDVEDQLVVRAVKYVMHRHDQIDSTETGCKMSARFGDMLDQKRAQFFTKRGKLLFVQRFQVFDSVDGIRIG